MIKPLLFATSLTLALMGCSSGGSDSGGSNNNGSNSSSSGSTSSSSSSSSSSSGGGQEIPTASNPVLETAAITDAAGLIITDDSGNASKPMYTKTPAFSQAQTAATTAENFDGSFAPNRLYKVTAEGDIVEVELTSTDQNSLRGVLTPKRITTMGNGWVLLYFDTEYQYVTRQMNLNYDEANGFQDYYALASHEVTNAYLVNQSTGAAYEAPWAAEGLVVEDGGDGFIDYSYTDENGEWVESADRVVKAYTWLDSPDSYLASTPAARFDNNGDMYVIGLVTDENGTGEEFGNPYSSYGRVLKVNTSNAGASSLTAEVIQTVDMDVQVMPNSLDVNADGQVAVYATQDWEGSGNIQTRVLNLRDQATYSLSAILNTSAFSLPIRGLDGDIYVGLDETISGTYSTGTNWEFSAPILGRLTLEADNQRPVFERAFVINGGRVLVDPYDENRSALIPTLAEWDAFPALLAGDAGLTVEEHNDWYLENIEPMADSLSFISTYWFYLPQAGAGVREIAMLSGQQVFIKKLWNGAPQEIYTLDLSAGAAQLYVREDFGFADFVSYAVNSESLFLFGEDSDLSLDRLVRWNPLTPSDVALIDIDIDTFDVRRFKVLNNNSVLLEADVLNPYSDGNISLASGAKILAEASFDGDVTIIDTIDAADAQILIMERVTPGDFITVDGDPQDWSLDYRVASDAVGDTVNETLGDLTYLNQLANDEYQWILAELAGSLGQTRLVVQLSADTSITVEGSSGSWVVADSSSNLLSTGAIFARGANAVEFRLPATLVAGLNLDGVTYPALSTVIDRVFGEVTLGDDAVDGSTGSASLAVELVRPVGPTTVTLDLGNGYSLTIADDNWNELDAEASDGVFDITLIDGNNGDAATALAAAGGSYSVSTDTYETIEVTLPVSALGMMVEGGVSVASQAVDAGTGVVTVVLDVPAEFGAASLSGFTHSGSASIIEVSNRQGDNFDVALVEGDSATVWATAGGSASFDSGSSQLTLTIPASALGFASTPAAAGITLADEADLSAEMVSGDLGAMVTSTATEVTIPVDDM